MLYVKLVKDSQWPQGSLKYSKIKGPEPCSKTFGGPQEDIKGPHQWNLETVELKGNQSNTYWVNPHTVQCH